MKKLLQAWLKGIQAGAEQERNDFTPLPEQEAVLKAFFLYFLEAGTHENCSRTLMETIAHNANPSLSIAVATGFSRQRINTVAREAIIEHFRTLDETNE